MLPPPCRVYMFCLCCVGSLQFLCLPPPVHSSGANGNCQVENGRLEITTKSYNSFLFLHDNFHVATWKFHKTMWEQHWMKWCSCIITWKYCTLEISSWKMEAVKEIVAAMTAFKVQVQPHIATRNLFSSIRRATSFQMLFQPQLHTVWTSQCCFYMFFTVEIQLPLLIFALHCIDIMSTSQF